MRYNQFRLDNIDLTWLEEQALSNPIQIYAFIDGLFEPRFSVGQLGISRQELQYWKKHGLITIISDEDTRTWVKVSFFDYCWLRLVAEMRNLFIPIEYIRKVKQELFSIDADLSFEQYKSDYEALNKSGKLNGPGKKLLKDILNEPDVVKNIYKKHLNYFIFLIFGLITKNSLASLIIDKHGNFNLLLLNEKTHAPSADDLLSKFTESFTAINLNNLLNEFYTNPRIKEIHIKDIFRLTDKETKILMLLRKEGVKEVRVRMGNMGKGIIMVEIVEVKDISKIRSRLQGILDKEKYQNIKISSEKGNILYFEETTKIKI